MFDLIFGVIIGFIIAFFVLKRSINKTGYGQLKVCRNTCPFYQSAMNKAVKDDVDNE